MKLFTRSPRDINKLLEDPQFPFQVGRLMGAAEMTSHWMMIQADEQQREVGRRLAQVVDWFFDDDNKTVRPGIMPPLPEKEIQERAREV